ncbi:MAG: hypothetical protein RLZZ423_475 [Cyanobacteriota bacterium]|jgi:uncharacterized membrane protein YfcA
MPWELLPLLPLGILAGLLSGLLGIGGGLIFSPLLLALGLPPHQALATSTLAIVPTTLAGSWAHLRSGLVPRPALLAIGLSAAAGAVLFSQASAGMASWQLLALQSLMYSVLAVVVGPRPAGDAAAAEASGAPDLPLGGIAAVGLVSGLASGMLGVGGGLVMVPLLVRVLGLRVYLAIRLSTLAVCTASASASIGLLSDGRALPAMGLLLGGVAGLAAQWSAARLQRVSERRLVQLLRLLCVLLALDGLRRAVPLVLAG